MTSLISDKFERTCRTCLNTDGEMVSIFSPSDIYVDLPEKLMAFIEIQISENDDLPNTICKKCIFLADSLYCFKKQCESADIQLKSLLSRKPDNSTDSDTAASSWVLQKRVSGRSPIVREKSDETEYDYAIEYISEETKNEVENAMRRRLEAERRNGMKKVSETVRNLKGIEVVPVNEFSVKRKGKISRVKQSEEIVVFPVNLPSKRSWSIEEIVIDDPEPPEKRLRKPIESKLEKIEADDARGDIIVYEKHKRLNFTTVRKMVRIDGQKLGVRVEEKKRGDDEGEISSIATNAIVDLMKVNNETEKLQTRYPVIRIAEMSLKKEEGMKIEDENYLRTQLDSQKFLEATSANVKETTESGSIFTLEIDDAEEFKIDEDLDDNHEEAEEEDVLVLTDDNDDEKSTPIFSCKKSKANDISDKCLILFKDNNITNVDISRKTRSKNFSDWESNRLPNYEKIPKKSDDSIFSNEAMALPLPNVNSSGKENRIMNVESYPGEGVKEVKKNSLPKDQMFWQRKFGKPCSKFYQCSICLANFTSMPLVLRHNAEEHMAADGPFFCLMCDTEFEKKLSLLDHTKEHSGSKPYKCTFCPKKFTLQRNLRRHVNHHINYKSFSCEICTKKFSDRSSLKSHGYLHTGDSPFACKICNVSFNNKTNWRRHVVTTHEKLTAVSCKYCGKELPDKRSLDVHERIHTGERPYQCPHCDKRFTQRCNLKTHIHCHLDDRPFLCHHCGKGFNQRGTRDDHILTHTGEKPHKCTECDASFTVVSALKRHMWIHSDEERPHNCDKCELSFVGLYDLKRHVKLRHGKSSESSDVPRSEENKAEDMGSASAILVESEADSNGAGKCEFVEPCASAVEYGKGRVEIPTNNDDSLYFRLTNSADLQTETKDHSASHAETENLMNGAKREELEICRTVLEAEAEGFSISYN